MQGQSVYNLLSFLLHGNGLDKANKDSEYAGRKSNV